MILDEAKKAALSASVAPVEVTPQPGALMIRRPHDSPSPSSSPSPFYLQPFPAKARSDDRAVPAVCQAPCCPTTCFGVHAVRPVLPSIVSRLSIYSSSLVSQSTPRLSSPLVFSPKCISSPVSPLRCSPISLLSRVSALLTQLCKMLANRRSRVFSSMHTSSTNVSQVPRLALAQKWPSDSYGGLFDRRRRERHVDI